MEGGENNWKSSVRAGDLMRYKSTSSFVVYEVIEVCVGHAIVARVGDKKGLRNIYAMKWALLEKLEKVVPKAKCGVRYVGRGVYYMNVYVGLADGRVLPQVRDAEPIAFNPEFMTQAAE